MDNINGNMSSSCSWSSGKHEISPQHSPWLQTTLSDIKKKMKTVIMLLEVGNSSDQRKQELIQMLKDFETSYGSLAQEYDQLRCKTYRKLEASDFHSQCISGDHGVECKMGSFDFSYLDRLADELASIEPHRITSATESKITENEKLNVEAEMTLNGIILQVTKLIEENLQQQAELLKRNEEKRNIINALRAELVRLKREDRKVQTCPECSEVHLKNNPPQIRSRGQHYSKFFKLGCS